MRTFGTIGGVAPKVRAMPPSEDWVARWSSCAPHWITFRDMSRR
jgi:hypothetical protein